MIISIHNKADTNDGQLMLVDDIPDLDLAITFSAKIQTDFTIAWLCNYG